MSNKDYPWISEKWVPLYETSKPNDSLESKVKRALLAIEITETELARAIEHAKNFNPGGQQVQFNNEFMNIPLPRLYKIMLHVRRIRNMLESKQNV